MITAGLEHNSRIKPWPDAMPASWIHIVSHLDPKYGGLSAVVPQLCSAVAEAHGYSIGIDAFCREGEEYVPSVRQGVTVRYWPHGRRNWVTDWSLRSKFKEAIRRADGVHIHGLWDQSTSVAASFARSLGKPYILSAHGMLEHWALRNKKFKKQIYSALIERPNIEGAACLHALTEAEADDYRRFGSRSPIAVIPNGVSLPLHATPDAFLAAHPALKGKRILLFLGRLHFKKGLDLLINAFAQLSSDWPDVCLVLAGPDSENTRASIESLVSNLHLAEKILFTGMLGDGLKWSALAASECFLLPSYSEGLSVSTLEAMGMGLPVIITEQCHLPEVVKYGGGWQVRSNVGELVAAMRELLTNPRERNQQIGIKGKKLVSERYNWLIVGSMMSELYCWVQHGISPKLVHIQSR